MSESGNVLDFWMTRNESRQQQTSSGLSTAHVQLISRLSWELASWKQIMLCIVDVE